MISKIVTRVRKVRSVILITSRCILVEGGFVLIEPRYDVKHILSGIAIQEARERPILLAGELRLWFCFDITIDNKTIPFTACSRKSTIGTGGWNRNLGPVANILCLSG